MGQSIALFIIDHGLGHEEKVKPTFLSLEFIVSLGMLIFFLEFFVCSMSYMEYRRGMRRSLMWPFQFMFLNICTVIFLGFSITAIIITEKQDTTNYYMCISIMTHLWVNILLSLLCFCGLNTYIKNASVRKRKRLISQNCPRSNYKKRKGESIQECTICCEEFKSKECIRQPKECTHKFHDNCLTPWLMNHNTCPNCRVEIFPIIEESISMMLSSDLEEPNDDELVVVVVAEFHNSEPRSISDNNYIDVQSEHDIQMSLTEQEPENITQ